MNGVEKRKAFSNKDARARQTGKKGKTNSSYFEESSSHINIAPNRVPFGTLHNMPNTNGAPINMPLQTTSPQNTSRNKENITPLQTPRSYRSTSVSTNVSVDPAIQKKRDYNRLYYQRSREKKIAETNANMDAHTPVGATQYLSGLTRESTIGKKPIHIMFFFTEFGMHLLIHVFTSYIKILLLLITTCIYIIHM